MIGYAILGERTLDRTITIRLENPLALARSQSALARTAALLPAGITDPFVEGETYAAVAEKIAETLAAQGAVAEVRVVDGASLPKDAQSYFLSRKVPGTLAPEDDVWKFARTYKWGVAAGVGFSGILALLWYYFSKKGTP